jgi:hypothetical protein
VSLILISLLLLFPFKLSDLCVLLLSQLLLLICELLNLGRPFPLSLLQLGMILLLGVLHFALVLLTHLTKFLLALLCYLG